MALGSALPHSACQSDSAVQTTTSEVCLRHGKLFETFQSLSFSNFYVPSCRARVCTTFCMNGALGREFLGLHPFFTVKNGWKIKQKSLFLKPKSLFLHDTFFSLNCVCIPQGHPDSYGSYLAYDSSKRKKYHKKEKHTLSKEILKFRNKNFRSLIK